MKIDIIGKGNVGSHLVKALTDKCDIMHVNSHTLDKLRIDADIYLICVKDDAIYEVLTKLTEYDVSEGTVIAHTSGSTDISIFKDFELPHTGVFYPLQTFSKDITLEYSEIPFFIEATDRYSFKQLKEAATLISESVIEADSNMRKRLHLASVFGCNFVNHLWSISKRLLDEQAIDFKYLIPLIKETCRKIERTAPENAQTGPASRNDSHIIKMQLQQLEGKEDLYQIYQLLTTSIINSKN